MEDKFKSFLEDKFRAIPPSVEAKEYRIKLLYQLKDKAQQLKLDGMKDDDLIYMTAISSLGNIDNQILEFEKRRLNPEPIKSFTKKMFSIALIYTLIILTAFLTISFVTHAWNKTWLVIVGGIFLAISTIFTLVSVLSAKKKKYLLMRIFAVPISVFVFIFIYLMILMLGDLEYDWFIVLIMVISIFLVDAVIAYATKSKIAFLSLITFIVISSVLIYVMLGISQLVAWNKGWLILMFGIIISVIILLAYIKPFGSKKKRNKNIDEKNYTSWE